MSKSEVHAEASVLLPKPSTIEILEKKLIPQEDERGRISDLLYFVFRGMWLSVCFIPMAVSYPLLGVALPILGVHTEWIWWNWYFQVVSISGPAVVKLYQWAATRRDIFSTEFCTIFGQLHTQATPHSWADTERILDLAVPEWKALLDEVDKVPIGSGCVGQVYQATLSSRGRAEHSPEARKVAIKILHPGVRRKIDTDLHWISWGAYILDSVPTMRWLSFQEHVKEFSKLMYTQLDLRVEAENLKRFRENFGITDRDHSGIVHFPKPYLELCSASVLVESFEDGIPLSTYFKELKNHVFDHPKNDLESKKKLFGKQLAKAGCDAFIKMLFTDNFIHGDLHPGNILVSFPDERDRTIGVGVSGTAQGASSTFWTSMKDWFSEDGQKPRLTFLDAGIVTQLEPQDMTNFTDVFRAVVQRQGYKVGELILERSPHQECLDPERFKKEMGKLILEATNTNIQLSKLQVGVLLSQVLNLSRTHRVKLDSAFTSTVLAVIIIEGIGRTLDPSLNILKIAFRALVPSPVS